MTRKFLVVRYDVTGWRQDQIDYLAGEAVTQGEASEGHPSCVTAVAEEEMEKAEEVEGYTYRAVNERGREVVEASLPACIESIAFVSRMDVAKIVTRERAANGARSWEVYEDQAAMDRDADRTEACEWFAIIYEERPKS